MTVSINIGTNPKDIKNIAKIREIVNNSSNDSKDVEDAKTWLNEIYKLLTDPSVFSSDNYKY